MRLLVGERNRQRIQADQTCRQRPDDKQFILPVMAQSGDDVLQLPRILILGLRHDFREFRRKDKRAGILHRQPFGDNQGLSRLFVCSNKRAQTRRGLERVFCICVNQNGFARRFSVNR